MLFRKMNQIKMWLDYLWKDNFQESKVILMRGIEKEGNC